jgi:hypothetical protein
MQLYVSLGIFGGIGQSGDTHKIDVSAAAVLGISHIYWRHLVYMTQRRGDMLGMDGAASWCLA